MDIDKLLELAGEACEAEREAQAARHAFFAAMVQATDTSRPKDSRVPVKALADRLGMPRGTLLSRMNAYRAEHESGKAK